ncbi:hypothetical protein D9M69_634100 [compost metagenome]
MESSGPIVANSFIVHECFLDVGAVQLKTAGKCGAIFERLVHSLPKGRQHRMSSVTQQTYAGLVPVF